MKGLEGIPLSRIEMFGEEMKGNIQRIHVLSKPEASRIALR